MRQHLRASAALRLGALASAALLATPPLAGQGTPTSRVWATATSGWPFPTEQSAHETHAGPGPRTWRVVLHPARVDWYRVQAYAVGSGRVMAQLSAAGRPLQPAPRQLNGSAYATDWIVCTSASTAPLVLEVQSDGAAEWAFGLWVPPVTTPMPPCR